MSLTGGILRLYAICSSTMVRMDASFWAKHGNLQWLKTKCMFPGTPVQHRRRETKQLQYYCCNYDINNMITFVIWQCIRSASLIPSIPSAHLFHACLYATLPDKLGFDNGLGVTFIQAMSRQMQKPCLEYYCYFCILTICVKFTLNHYFDSSTYSTSINNVRADSSIL